MLTVSKPWKMGARRGVKTLISFIDRLTYVTWYTLPSLSEPCFFIYNTDFKGCVSRIYKELLKLNNKRKKWIKDLNSYFTKDYTQMVY